MNYLQEVLQSIRTRLFVFIVLENILLITFWYLAVENSELSISVIAFISIVASLFISAVATYALSNYLLQPLKFLRDALLHISPKEHGVAPPNLEQLTLGKQLVSSLVSQIYEISSLANSRAEEKPNSPISDFQNNFIAKSLPLPLITLDSTETITYANSKAAEYIGIAAKDLIGKNVYMILDMSFPSEDTFDNWLKKAKTSAATSSKLWNRVRLNVSDSHPLRLFDLAVYYNKGNDLGSETMLVMFDHTKEYSQDDQAISFIALSVHELRTPLTLLRGYIEVLEDEMDSSNPELKDFMMKLRSQAEQLTAFVNNILNVARIEEDQLVLNLQEEDWSSVLTKSIENMQIRARVRGIQLNCTIAENIPTVGIDHISIIEVINNLVDNAIKYSGTSKKIDISAYVTKDGLVETTIKDYGLGISASVVPNLFTKFYRDHRNRAQIGGTGLGLYLCKAIIDAHSGNIWVRSKEGQGSIFGFTLVPYLRLAEEKKKSGDKGIVRSAHGWIKNHSLYRR